MYFAVRSTAEHSPLDSLIKKKSLDLSITPSIHYFQTVIHDFSMSVTGFVQYAVEKNRKLILRMLVCELRAP